MGLIFTPPGEVLLAENTCTTAVTEMCSHVGALLFWVWVIVPCRDSQTVTNRSANCILLSNVNKEHAEVCHKIDYTSAFARRITLNSWRTVLTTGSLPWNLCLKQTGITFVIWASTIRSTASNKCVLLRVCSVKKSKISWGPTRISDPFAV